MYIFLNEEEDRETVVSVLSPAPQAGSSFASVFAFIFDGRKIMKRTRQEHREEYGGEDAGVKPGARKSVQATNSLNTTFRAPGTGASGGHVMMRYAPACDSDRVTPTERLWWGQEEVAGEEAASRSGEQEVSEESEATVQEARPQGLPRRPSTRCPSAEEVLGTWSVLSGYW